MTIIEVNPRADGGHGLQSQSGRTSCWLTGWVEVPSHLEAAVWDTLGWCDLNIEDGKLIDITPTERPEPEKPENSYIPTPEISATVFLRSMFSAQVETMDDDAVIQCSGLVNEWAPGNHKIGEIYNTADQTWECYQAYDNDVYPDIKPNDPSWYTFNRPLHGKSAETARPWVTPMGAHDMYHTGEYMVYSDQKIYKCLSDTNFSPDDNAQAWEVINGSDADN